MGVRGHPPTGEVGAAPRITWCKMRTMFGCQAKRKKTLVLVTLCPCRSVVLGMQAK